MSKMCEKTVEEQVAHYKKSGFNPIKIVGNLYLVRYNPYCFAKVSWYYPKIFKKMP